MEQKMNKIAEDVQEIKALIKQPLDDHSQDQKIKINIQGSEGSTFPVRVSSESTVRALKRKLHEQEGIPPERQTLIFEGSQLEDGRTLADCNILDGSTIGWMLGMQLSVKMQRGGSSTFQVVVRPSDTVHDLKKAIKDKTGVPTEKQRLWFGFGYTALKDHKAMRDLGIKEGSTIVLEEAMQLSVQMQSDGSTFQVAVLPYETLGDLKKAIKDKTEIPTERQRLWFWNMELKDHQTMRDCGVEPGSLIDLQETMQLTVERQSDGSKFQVVVWPSKTVSDLKKAINDKKGVPTGRQRLWFENTWLSDHQTMRDVGIEKGSKIVLLEGN